MLIIADENIDHELIRQLEKSHEVFSVYYQNRGISDNDVIKLAQQRNCIILTEDKDFGEYVFAHLIKTISVVLLRYQFHEREEMYKRVVSLFSGQEERFRGKFTTITIHKIRSRDL